MVVFALSRVPGMLPQNFSAAYGLLFCAGVYFSGRSAWWVPLTTLLVTFGLSVVIENALQQFFSANSRSLNIGSLVSDSFSIGPHITIAYLDLAIFVVAVIVLLGLQYLLTSSRQGRLIRAVADDREAAQLAGARRWHWS